MIVLKLVGASIVADYNQVMIGPREWLTYSSSYFGNAMVDVGTVIAWGYSHGRG